jgi:hypothetical protein
MFCYALGCRKRTSKHETNIEANNTTLHHTHLFARYGVSERERRVNPFDTYFTYNNGCERKAPMDTKE